MSKKPVALTLDTVRLSVRPSVRPSIRPSVRLPPSAAAAVILVPRLAAPRGPACADYAALFVCPT